MDREEKKEMMDQMMEQFLDGMTGDDKKKIMAEMMPKMMMGMMGGEEGNGMMGMMSKMMAGGKDMQMPMMPAMMMEMMPQCLSVMLPHIPKDDRIAFVLKMVTTLIEKGSEGFTDKEKKEFVEKVAGSIKPAL